MKIKDILSYNKNSKRPCFSFEFFPPKTEEGKINLELRMSKMLDFGPSFAAVTWGAGSSTSEKSIDLADVLQNDLGLDALLHITATNTSKKKLIKNLKLAKDKGIENILALRGDPPMDGLVLDDDVEADKLGDAIELIKLIKHEFKDHFNIGVAAYPAGHPESRGLEEDIKHLKKKVEAGADFILTQFFFSSIEYSKWLNKLRENGITIPIIPSIMILQSYPSFRRLISLTGIKVPDELLHKLEAIKHDDSLVKEMGINIAVELIKGLMVNYPSNQSNEIPCVHFFTMNLEKSVHQVLLKLGWLKKEDLDFKINGIDNQILLNVQENWDNFPNGRFGNSSSPAYGNLEGYRNGLKIAPNKALELWGHPESLEEISNLFINFLKGKLSELPWCEPGDLDPESEIIKEYLIEINKKKCFTLSSQPSLDAIPSSHPIYGWGPKKGGFIFQKAFIELLIPRALLNPFLAKIIAFDPNITYMAVDHKGQFLSNGNKDHNNEYEASTVTWGVFSHGEIAQATLIEASSFKAWAKEVFQISEEWHHLFINYPKSQKLILDLKQDYFLVNLVDHDFKHNQKIFFKGVVDSLS